MHPLQIRQDYLQIYLIIDSGKLIPYNHSKPFLYTESSPHYV